MEKSAKALTQRWDDWFADPIDLADARELVTDTRQFLADVPAHTSFTNAQLLEIMMAQDFQDLTGQVIKRMMDVIQEIERQLLMVLLENIPEQESRPKRENQSLLNGPQVDTSKAGVVASQDQVDDLLDSLDFDLYCLMWRDHVISGDDAASDKRILCLMCGSKSPKSRLFCPLLKPLNALRSGIIYA